MPLPLYVSSPEERAQLIEIESIRRIRAIAGEADLWVMGISQIGEDAILYRDGFMMRGELLDMVRHGAVGEVTGWVFDAEGRFLDRGTNLRVTSVPPERRAAWEDRQRPRHRRGYGPRPPRGLTPLTNLAPSPSARKPARGCHPSVING
jgi:DNA-binding transcriptional regulator LsrR (DeoR family)